jgi:hypothetical protein
LGCLQLPFLLAGAFLPIVDDYRGSWHATPEPERASKLRPL